MALFKGHFPQDLTVRPGPGKNSPFQGPFFQDLETPGIFQENFLDFYRKFSWKIPGRKIPGIFQKFQISEISEIFLGNFPGNTPEVSSWPN